MKTVNQTVVVELQIANSVPLKRQILRGKEAFTSTGRPTQYTQYKESFRQLWIEANAVKYNTNSCQSIVNHFASPMNDFLNTIAHNMSKRGGHQPSLNQLMLFHAHSEKVNKFFINKSYRTPTETDNRLHVISWSCFACDIPLPE